MTAVGLLKELQAIGLIDMVQRSGLANIIYVKNFVSCDKTEEKGEVEALDRYIQKPSQILRLVQV